MYLVGATHPFLPRTLRVQMSKNVRRHIRQYVAPAAVSEQSKGPVDYAVRVFAVNPLLPRTSVNTGVKRATTGTTAPRSVPDAFCKKGKTHSCVERLR